MKCSKLQLTDVGDTCSEWSFHLSFLFLSYENTFYIFLEIDYSPFVIQDFAFSFHTL
jgi:hypothetical protein